MKARAIQSSHVSLWCSLGSVGRVANLLSCGLQCLVIQKYPFYFTEMGEGEEVEQKMSKSFIPSDCEASFFFQKGYKLDN